MKEVFRRFLQDTSYGHISTPPQDQEVPQPPLELPLPENAQVIALPQPKSLTIPAADLRTVIEQRRSLRKYSAVALNLEELSYLLWLTQGVQRITSRPVTLRTVPSAGARYAFETIVLVNRVDGLEPGLYRFAASQHSLVRVDAPADIAEQVAQACGGQGQVTASAVTFIWVAVTERMSWRYVERGMRYLFLDAGHVCQNLYLAAESIGCGVCAIAAYNDEHINDLLHLDGLDQFVIYLGTLGKR